MIFYFVRKVFLIKKPITFLFIQLKATMHSKFQSEHIIHLAHLDLDFFPYCKLISHVNQQTSALIYFQDKFTIHLFNYLEYIRKFLFLN
ncbi:hypothetical protein BpHYR1_037083 [Brachionus plicatilis]|uniref:Uncharacterized protein n=1 Tax=Brachionus plicatilis TaxID=10195 RepID=A0A3M7SBF1_BRAPC|nr:hypothetical protein BpHYR1_037083 [Brachionus plicatilis]